jgi:hypothetical protein
MWTSVSPWIQASEGEIRQALEEGPAFELDGRWRGIDPGYLDHLLDVMIVTAQGFCELTAIPEGRMVGRCRLTLSKSVLKAPMVSALEAKI